MAEGTYEYECMRAELLGVGKPDYEEFMQRKREAEENRRLAAEVEQEGVETAHLETTESQGETLKSTGGKLEDLNNILSSTQKRLDRIKVRCGSVTELIRTKIGGTTAANEAPSTKSDPREAETSTSQQPEVAEVVLAETTAPRRTDLSRAMDNHVDKLDSLLSKAERAELSLNRQNKQIKKFLK